MKGWRLALLLLALPSLAAADERPLGDQFAIAIERANLAAVKALIDGGAAPDTYIKYGEHKTLPLIKASHDGRRDIVKYLLSAGANVNGKSVPLGETALQAACSRGFDDIVEVLLLSVVVTTLWAVIGVAFGSVLTNQVAAIVVILAFTQFVEPIARVALGAFDALDGVARFLPGAAADGLIGASLLGSMDGGSADLLPRWAALLVMLAYAGVLAAVGRFTTLRRDIG